MDYKSYTHIALVLDASGSMGHLRESTITTLKSFFEALRSSEDKVVVDLWQFDDRVRHLVAGEDLVKGASSTLEGYTTGGCTALYDAICTGIDELGAKFAAMNEAERPDAVVFAILTDGFENASRQFSVRDVKARITHQSEKYSWTFRFLAANQDACLTGREMGLEEESCRTIVASDKGISMCCCEMSGEIAGDIRKKARRRRATKKGL